MTNKLSHSYYILDKIKIKELSFTCVNLSNKIIEHLSLFISFKFANCCDSLLVVLTSLACLVENFIQHPSDCNKAVHQRISCRIFFLLLYSYELVKKVSCEMVQELMIEIEFRDSV